MQDFRGLRVWQKAHEVVLAIYGASGTFPASELHGLTSQIRRASVSIPSNIAEGCGRGTNAELAQFAQIAMGSASEVEYQLLLAQDLGFLDANTYSKLNADLLEVKKMLNVFIQRVRETK